MRVAVMVCALSTTLSAQQWNDPRALTLVRQATERRAQQLADSGLVDYQAKAHGYLTFLAQLGEGFREPPQVVKADELALEVYWRAPNLSKQRIVGRRDTTLLPTDINYHRDHLGIVQNNFPAVIRLGDGDEVMDVPHPLSPSGLVEYDFALSDSLRITIPGRVIGVYEVKVRPKNDRQPRVIGALYLDRDNGEVVRMALSFTRAAFKDKQLEDLFVVLENGLVGTRFWLPRRQEIEIRRTATWLDYPIRGIIRGRWEIGEYEMNRGIPIATFAGPEIVQAPPSIMQRHQWPSARILDSLPPDVRAVTAEEILRVQAEVRQLVREQALRRVRSSALAARGVSDIVRFNRVEGLAFGAGLSWRLGNGLGLAGSGRYGLEDQKAKGRVEASWQNAGGTMLRAYYASDFRDVGDVAERSPLINSIAAQEFGSDYTNPYSTELTGAGLAWQTSGARWSFDVAHERHRELAIHAAPATGAFVPPVGAAPIDAWRGVARYELPTTLWRWGTEARHMIELRGIRTSASTRSCGVLSCAETDVARFATLLELERPFGEARLTSRTFVAQLWGRPLVAQELIFLGGPMTAPGYGFHELVGSRAASQSLGVLLPIPFPSIRLGRFGRSPARAQLEPHVNGVHLRALDVGAELLRASVPVAPRDPLRLYSTGFYSSAGVRLITAFDLFRFDLSRALGDRGRWIFSFDVSRPFWSIL
jgi:hypothetical protein